MTTPNVSRPSEEEQTEHDLALWSHEWLIKEAQGNLKLLELLVKREEIYDGTWETEERQGVGLDSLLVTEDEPAIGEAAKRLNEITPIIHTAKILLGITDD